MLDPIEPNLALTFVNLLGPEFFIDAEKWLRPSSEYYFSGSVLRGVSLLSAFKESHAKAMRELDAVEYLPGTILAISEDSMIVGVSDKLLLNKKTHIYSDRLAVALKRDAQGVYVARIEHLPIQEERDKLKNFLQSAGPKHWNEW